jgi:carbon-monoxide dehydrogenase medium subunit
LKPAPFEYRAPASLSEAVDALAEADGDAKILAGGQSLIPILALRLSAFDRLVDLGRIDALREIGRVDGAVRVGAMTTQADAERDATVRSDVPLLARALPFIGHFQIRNRGTVGGSLAHADPAAELPAVATALDAVIEIAGPDGTRECAATDFFVATFMTGLGDAEIVTGIRFPVWGPDAGFAVDEVARRHGDFAIVGAACGVETSGGKVSRAAISMFGMAGTPVRAAAAERALVGSSVGGADADEVGRLATEGLDPPDDVHASTAYRRDVGAKVVARVVRRALEEAHGG